MTYAERFLRIVREHSCRECGAPWADYSLSILEGQGHGLLLCTSEHLFCVLYPEGRVLDANPATTPPSESTVLSTRGGSDPPRPGAFSATDHGDGAAGETRGSSTNNPVSQSLRVATESRIPGVGGSSPPVPQTGRCALCHQAHAWMGARPAPLCLECLSARFALLEVGGTLRLTYDGRPVPWSPDVGCDGEAPRRVRALEPVGVVA